jgi:hypothetical protein
MSRTYLFAVLFTASYIILTLNSVEGAQNVTARSTLCETGCLLPPLGLLGWWPGDGNANDIQLGSDGIPMNGASFAPKLVGQVFSFDGVDDFVDVPDTPALHVITTAVTVDAWINPQESPFGEDWIFARRDPLISEGISLYVNNGGFLITSLQTTDVGTEIGSAVPVIKFGQWQHVAVTADTATGQVRLYVNGKGVATQVVSGSSQPISGRFVDVTHLFIGQRQDSDTPEGAPGAQRYNGLIDEVEVYNRVLSEAEIQAIFYVGARGKCKPSL